ncbi:MAG: serine/threonine-protein kinase, partial [Candidatus Poribacteria bacterium]|nr:serine/threonine-protein kinase [Candidatus Poribacteria bacterium]
MAFLNGESFGKYKILSEIGKGGMGEVYLAEDTELDRKIAIKFLSDEFSNDTEKLNRFVQEAKAASALNHPNILTVYEIGKADDRRYIATEYIEGQTLRERLSKKESVPLNNMLKIGIQVAEALSAAHGAGIIHRDIKPENIMIRDDGYVKVLDFGLAKLTEKKSAEEISLEGETKALVKTNPGVVMGTVSYMSPEQARGRETDERTDIWSLGVVLYEMLSGKVPFAGETLNHTIVAILETEPKLLENVPDELQRIVRKALTKEKRMRYQTALDLLIDLKNLRDELKMQGEIERSIIPNKDLGTTAENETAVYTNKSIEETDASGQVPVTQNVTTASSLEYAVT